MSLCGIDILRHISYALEITKSEKCRPDWDLATSGRREKWEQGKKEGFYPYKKVKP